MGRFVAYRDGGKTDEKGFYHFLSDLLSGNTVGTSFAIVQHAAGANMSVDVSIGDALIPTGTGYAYQAYTDAVENPTITTANATNPRNDIVVAYVDITVVQSTTADNPNALLFAVIAGTPAGSPADPSDATIQAAVGASNPFIKLARVRVNANAASITNANITDLRTAVSVNATIGGSDGWISSLESWTYATNDGGKQFTVTVGGDKTSKYSAGMKVKVPRGTTPPTQSMSFASASSQYATKSSPAGISFSAAFTCEAWIFVNSYTLQQQLIIDRTDNPFQNGWVLRLSTSGQLEVSYASSNVASTLTSYQSIPLNRWVHVAGVITSVASKTGALYINGNAVPSFLSGTATALTQSGNLSVGGGSTGIANTFFNGLISEARVWSVAQSQASIQANMAISLTGAETNLVGLFKGNGNFNDSTANANNLTATNGPVATAVSNPYYATEYGIITAVSYSSGTGLTTITVFTGTDYTIPNQTLGSPSYSLQSTPFGFPRSSGRWKTDYIALGSSQITSPTTTPALITGRQISVPIGEWKVKVKGIAYADKASPPVQYVIWALSTTTNSYSDPRLTSRAGLDVSSVVSNEFINAPMYFSGDVPLSAVTTYNLLVQLNANGGTGDLATLTTNQTYSTVIEFESAYM